MSTAKQETQYEYGKSVVEFFPFNQEELDALITKATTAYMAQTEGLLYKKPAANISFSREPLRAALNELRSLQDQGYTIHPDRYAGMQGASLDLVLQKPSSIVEQELETLREEVLQDYEADRYSRNAKETERQVSITLDRIEREAEAKRVASEASAAAKAREQAMKDLRAAYAV